MLWRKVRVAGLILSLGVVYHGSMTSWKWIAVAALAFFVAPALADSTGKSRVVIDQRSGTVVITDDVRISTVAVTVGGLVIRTLETPGCPTPLPGPGRAWRCPAPASASRRGRGGGWWWYRRTSPCVNS